jgi:hypothetical protein
MTKPRDPEALLSAYLAEGMEVLPDRVADAVLDEIHRTRQRAVFSSWRTRSMARTAVAAVAVVAAVALGGVFFVIQRGLPAVSGPSPTPSTDPTASLPAVVAPSSTPSTPSAAPTSSAVTNPAGVWIATGWMGTPRDRFTAVRLNDGRVLVTGGSEDEHDTSAELYDPARGTWSPTGNMLRVHRGFPATLLSDGRVLVGDVDDPAADDTVNGAELYDPASGTWTATGKMVNGGESTATLLRDGKVLVIGYNDTGEVYDPDSDTWTATGMMADPRHSHVAILLPDGSVLVAGGHAPGDQPTDSAELYDPDTGTWNAIANMHAKRGGPEAFLQPDGKVVVVGSSRGEPQSAELYDPATGTWTATEDMIRAGQFYQSLTLLSDGRVLVRMADLDGTRPTAMELYDPDTRSWTTAAPMLRSHETPATLLLDGTVLAAGGHDCLDGVCVATGSAELYIPRGVSPPALAALPSPTPRPIPTPTPRPTPFPPADGPVPPGARTWTVTVDNKSSEPATLFLAEDGENGIGRLCGSATPNVVPARATVRVTFLLPPKSVKSCWIWMNPVPGEGGSFFQTSDAPMKGGFLITADGQTMWGGS